VTRQAIRPATRETQPERTRLSWRRTWLSLAAVGAAEARLVAEHRSAATGAVLGTAAVLGLVAWAVLHRRDAVLATSRVAGDGLPPALVAAGAVGVGLLGAVVVLAT
jgi:putative membrane protein